MQAPSITIVSKPIAALIEAEYNPRTITDRQFDQLKDSLKRFGFVDPVLVNMHPDREHIIIGGHMRTKAAEALGYTEVPCVELSLTLEQEKELNIRLNKSGGSFDFDMLANYFEKDDLKEWGFEDWEFGETEDVTELEPAEEGEVNLDPPKEPITVLGDLYELNGHRVLCGDSTDSDIWGKLDISSPSMTFTSPPYGVGDNAKLRDHYEPGKEDRKSLYATHEDNPDTWSELMLDWTAMAVSHTDVVVCNVQMLANNKRTLVDWISEYQSHLIDIAVWDKGHGAPQMQSGVLTNAFEWMILLSGSENASRKIPLANFHGTISNIVRVSPHGKNEFASVHRAVYPIELVEWGIILCDEAKTIVDPFGGTGTTLIAAEKHGKAARLIELDPLYTDVIIRRWVKYMQDNNRPYTVKRNGEQLSAQEIDNYFAN
ncbi:DNA methylase [Pontibacter mucosus]|uniref:Methyltransferase n=1 Tax=Pontibacter mucosus TaxID=1649266 RepID=A0A2T5YD55_9BACT|nr:ParB N-terminal domain-containing protein [Pontibacter mucosus]PTX14435.1 DNA methylase [Pontibacter mucosus]